MAADLSGQRLGQYEVISLLGEGGMAAVYRARQTSVKRDVAIKVIKTGLIQMDEFVARFKREAETIAQLDHLHILKVFDYGQQDDMVYLVMQLLTGGSLAELIRKGPLSPEHASRLLDQMAMALDYAHSQSVIHRDMKPQNVLLDRDGNAFLTDFGIAKLLGQNTVLTQSGGAMGTPAYMAPEQWRGEPVDGRADVYSLGIIVYEMLTGKLPFEGDTAFGLMHKHVYVAPSPIRDVRPDLPLSIERVINKALAKNRDQRFESAGALAAAFKRAVEGTYNDTGAEVFLVETPPEDMPRTAAGSGGGTAGAGRQPTAARAAGTGVRKDSTPGGEVSAPAAPAPKRSGLLPLALIALALLIVGGGAAALLSNQTQPTPTSRVPAVADQPTSTATHTSTFTNTPEPPTLTATPTPSNTPGVETIIARTLEGRATSTAVFIAQLSATPNEDQIAATKLAATDTAIAVASFTRTPTPTETLPPTATPAPTDTPAPTSTPTLEPTAIPTQTPVPVAVVETPFGGGKSQVLFTSNRDGNQEIYVVDADGQNARNLTRFKDFDDSNAVWSPDGSRIAFVSTRDGDLEIFVMNADGSDVRQITDNRNFDDYDPAWSPDGRQIAFTTNRDGNAEIYVMNADGTDPRRLTQNPSVDHKAAWSPDGRQIAFNSTREVGDQIYVMNADGSNVRRLSPRAGSSIGPLWSPDGTQIVFMSTREVGPNVWVMNADGSNAQRLTRGTEIATAPAWSADGRSIIYLSSRGLPVATRIFNIWIMGTDGSNPRRLGRDNDSAVEARLSWRP